MSREVRIAFLVAVMIALLVFSAINAVTSSHQTRAPELVEAMLREEDCLSPCFFGQSLRGKSFEEVDDIISRQDMMKDVAVRRVTQVNRQLISWIWPAVIKPRLTSEGLNMDQYFLFPGEDLNSIQFRDGELIHAQFVFLIRLDELIALRGEPEIASVGIYQSNAQALMLRYDDPSVSYAGHFLCRLPRLYPYTRVWAYEYASVPYDLVSNPTVAWAGYDAIQPSCDFPPS